MRKLKLQELNRLNVEEYQKTQKIPLVLVLDNIRSMQNVGSLFRTADGFAVEKIVLCGITAQPPHRDIQRAALGATESVDWSYIENVAEACSSLKKEGYQILALEQTSNSQFLKDFEPKPSTKYALVVGNEVDGVSDSVLHLVDQALEIEQFGTKHSFNVGVAAGMAIYQLSVRMRR
ncbi:MAG: RNA methyltransferase [Bacteroidetes bacterium]|nr:RNA methyltransferase [Bacteroidota bacterium]